MILSQKSLEILRDLINEGTEYRKGPVLVRFFNELGFTDSYGQGFPSRGTYTLERLTQINGGPEIDKCIKMLFNPVNFIGRVPELDKHIGEFNQYLAFDKWQVVRNGTEITFKKQDKINIEPATTPVVTEDEFLKLEFKDVAIDKLGLDAPVLEVIKERIDEIRKSLEAKAPLAVIFLCGSTLEGILLGVATKNAQDFNRSGACPKKDGKPKFFAEWTLSNLIDVAFEIGLIKQDIKKFSHSLRDFRNYIHPFQQVQEKFSPDIHTARISWQVLKAAIYQLQK